MTLGFAMRWVRQAVAVAAVAVILTTLRGAASWYGHPFASVLVDPGGVVSNYGSLKDGVSDPGLHFPDRVISVDGRPLAWSRWSSRAAVWDDAVLRAHAEGRQSITAVVQTDRGVVTRRLPVAQFGAINWWTYAGALIVCGILLVAAGMVAMTVGRGSGLATTFAKVNLFTGLACLTTFDFHTTRALVPVFFVAFAMMPLGWITLSLRLPDDAGILKRLPWLERGADAVAASVAATFLGLIAAGRSTEGLQRIWTAVMGIAFAFFGITFVVRFLRSRGLRHRRMRALFVSVVPTQLVIIGGLATPQTVSHVLGPYAESLSYAGLSLFPLATAYALIRYDLWGSRALLSRLLSRAAAVTLVSGLSIAIGTALSVQLGAPFRHALVAATLATLLAAGAIVVALGAVDRYLFAARSRYKPTVEQLGSDLISITSPEEVARALERTIQRWLPCDHVRVTLAEQSPSQSATDSGVFQSSPWAGGSAEPGAPLELDLEFGGTRLGSLVVGPKRDEALFTEDDLDLLRTIVNQGALAVAHAFAYQELETRRQEQAAAWRGERAALVETVAAEVAHEIRYPINFFRTFFKTQGTEPVDPEDLDIGREEVDRLERLVAGLRRMASRSLDRHSIPVADLCGRAEILLRDALGSRSIEREGVREVAISCDVDQMTQILVNLMANGLQAAGEQGRVGVRWIDGTDPCLVVWDDGPGFEGEPSALFAPWYTTKEKGTGLGLAITHRLVRAHGWQIEAQRSGGRTEFVVRIDPEDVGMNNTSTSAAPPDGASSREGTHRRRSA